MPHVVIDGPATVEKFYNDFEPTTLKEQGTVINIRDVFLSKQKTKVLIECTVVEDRYPINFYTLLYQGNGRLTVRFDPLTDPEKVDGVKRLLALVAHKVKSQDPACRYGTNNIEGFLVE